MAAAAGAQNDRSPTAHARLDPDIAGLDELLTFALSVEASGFSGLQVTPDFELENLEAVAGPFQSRSQRWVNGETSSSVQLTWRLRPKAVGPARVRGIRLVIGESSIPLPDEEAEIQAQAPPSRSRPAPGRRGDPFEDLFSRAFPDARATRRPPARVPKVRLEAEISPADPFVGQQATYTLWLYTQTDINAFQPTKIPDFRGFWVREIPQPQELRPEWVEEAGQRIGRVPMLRRAVFPLKAGRFVIDPTEADVVARIAEFGPFGSPFGRAESLHLKTEPVVLTARALPPLPAGFESFAGLIGEVTLSTRLDRTELEVGQAATLTVRATGRGNLQSLAPPVLTLPDGLRGFPPRQDSSERLTDGVLVSSAEWSYVLVPERPGRYALDGVRLPYFDPSKREYRLATAAPPSLSVEGVPGGPGEVTPPAATSAAQAPAQPESSPVVPASSFLSRVPLVWAYAALIVLLALAATFGARKLWRRPALGSARQLREAISRAGESGTPRQAAASLEEAWRQHLAERWSIPPGTPVSTWSDRLIAARADAGAAKKLADLAHELHYLRYAPELSAADHLLAEVLETSRRLARVLR